MVTERELNRVKIFANLGERITNKLIPLFRERTFQVDQAICHEGEPSHSMYVIRSGRVSVSKLTEDGAVELLRMGAWDFFGEMGAFLGEPRTATVRAVTPVVVLEIQRPDLLQLTEAHPLIGTRIRNEILRRQAETVRRLLGAHG